MFKNKSGNYRYLELRVYSLSPNIYEYLFWNNSSELNQWCKLNGEKYKKTPIESCYWEDPNILISDARLSKGLDYGDILHEIIQSNF